MKKCGICKVEKDQSEFHSNASKKDGLQIHCKTCQTRLSKEHYEANKAYYVAKARKAKLIQYAKNREAIRSYLETHPCVDCGEDDPLVLEFDHVRGTKVESVSVLAYSLGVPVTRILAEIEKCDIRCANCHRRKTAIQLGWFGYGSDSAVQLPHKA